MERTIILINNEGETPYGLDGVCLMFDFPNLQYMSINELNDKQKARLERDYNYLCRVHTNKNLIKDETSIVPNLIKLENTEENFFEFVKSLYNKQNFIYSPSFSDWTSLINIELTKKKFVNELGLHPKKKSVSVLKPESYAGQKFLELFKDDIIKYERVDMLFLLSEDDLKEFNLSTELLDMVYYLKKEYDKIQSNLLEVMYSLKRRNMYFGGLFIDDESKEKYKVYYNMLMRLQIQSDVHITYEIFLNMLYLTKFYDDDMKIFCKCAFYQYLSIMNKATYSLTLKPYIWNDELIKIRNEAIIDFFNDKPDAYKTYLTLGGLSNLNNLFTGIDECRHYMTKVFPKETTNKKIYKLLMDSTL